MMQVIPKRCLFAALMLAGLSFGCRNSAAPSGESSPTDALAEHFSASREEAPAAKSAPAPASEEVKPAAGNGTPASVPEPAPVPVVEKTVKLAETAVDAAVNPPPVSVNVQVNLPDNNRLGASAGFGEEETGLSVTLPAPGERMQRSKAKERGRERFRRGPGMWRLNARLTEGERRELRELQRENPERYRQVVRQKLDDLYAEDLARREELRTLVRTYQEAVDSEQKADLKRRMTLVVRSDFQRRLSENRLQFEDLRARSIKLERELDKRAANAEAIIAHQVEELLSGQMPPEEPPARFHHPDASPKAMRNGHRPPPPSDAPPQEAGPERK